MLLLLIFFLILNPLDPESVRMKQRIAAGNFRINGVELAPAEKTIAIGKRSSRTGLTRR